MTMIGCDGAIGCLSSNGDCVDMVRGWYYLPYDRVIGCRRWGDVVGLIR